MPTYFLDTINDLRTREEVLVHTKLMKISKEEDDLVIDLLQNDYEKESLNYPHKAPVFEEKAALWAAKIMYHSAQLLLYREQQKVEIETLLADYQGNITPSAILSADLCLRFLPYALQKAIVIDPTDLIIPILERHLQTWHYSGIGSEIDTEKIDFHQIKENSCLLQLYINRIVERKAIKLAQNPNLKSFVKANLGDYASVFWAEFV